MGIIRIDSKRISNDYTKLGEGVEGTIYNYNNEYAIKIFDLLYNDSKRTKKSQKKLNKKLKKVEILKQIQDPSFCFPIDFIIDEEMNKVGYYMDLLAKSSDDVYDFFKSKIDYKICKDKSKLFNILMEADCAIKRIHKKGIIIGDIHDENIVIDINDKPRFIDTDNYIYNGYGYDAFPWRAGLLKRSYGENDNPKDNDIFLYALLVMEFITGLEPNYQYIDVKEYLDKLLKCLNINKEVKNGLKIIFSSAQNKPYISDVLSEINPNEKIYQKVK